MKLKHIRSSMGDEGIKKLIETCQIIEFKHPYKNSKEENIEIKK